MRGRTDPTAQRQIDAVRAIAGSISAIRATRDAGSRDVAGSQAPPRVATIVKFVAEQMGLRVGDIIGARRSRVLVRARAAVTWIARTIAGRSWKQIALAMGDRHHTTIMHQKEVADRLCERDPAFRLVTQRAVRHFQERKPA